MKIVIRHRLSFGFVTDLVARAHALTGPLETTRHAMASGTVSPEQADVIVKSVDALPADQDPTTIEGRKNEQRYRDAFTKAMDAAHWPTNSQRDTPVDVRSRHCV